MLRSNYIFLFLVILYSCKKEDHLYSTDFSNLDDWNIDVGYNSNIPGDTAWVESVNNQLVLRADHKAASENGSYAIATYDFSYLEIDPNGLYIFELGVESPGIFMGEPNSVGFWVQFGTWTFSCKGYSGEMMTNEIVKFRLDLSNHSHIVTKLSNNEDISSTFLFFENSTSPNFKITFYLHTGSYAGQYDNSLEASFNYLKIIKVRE